MTRAMSIAGVCLSSLVLLEATGPLRAARVASARTASVRFTAATITIDGLLDDSAWHDADALADFQHPWGDAERDEAASIALLWGPDSLYLGARITDTHVVAAGRTVADMYGDDMLEVHIAPDIANPQYFFVYESNLNGVVNAQMRMSLPDGRNSWFLAWDTAAVERATTIGRASPEPVAGASGWVVELRIPFSALNGGRVPGMPALPRTWTPAVPPRNGDSWKFNLTRANYDTPLSPRHDFSVWSFNGSYAYGPEKKDVHFHDQNNFGVLTFVGRP